MKDWQPWHTQDGDPEEETLLELHLLAPDAHYHADIQTHGLRPHQHEVVYSRWAGLMAGQE